MQQHKIFLGIVLQFKSCRREIRIKLFTAGPVACYPEVLEEMKIQMFSHRSEEYKALHKETTEMIGDFLETEKEIFLFSSTGSGFMEAAVRNCVKESILCCVNGSFGKRFVDVAVSNGKRVEVISPPLGVPIEPDVLEDGLSRLPEVEAVAITHNETSAGIINDLKKLADIVRAHDKILIVDAVSSMGGTPIYVDEWGLDVCFSSSQKCFGVPPGLGIGSVSEKALIKSEKVKNKGWYFDFKVWESYQKNFGTPMTSVIPQVAGLNRILKLIEQWGGKRKYFELYSKRSNIIREGLKELGLNLFPNKGFESPTISCVNAPEGADGEGVYQKMRENGFELAMGYGELKKSTFRIGNMGYIEFDDIEEMLQSLGEVLTEHEGGMGNE
jgi:aspartate aminotransferase-like enzyme